MTSHNNDERKTSDVNKPTHDASVQDDRFDETLLDSFDAEIKATAQDLRQHLQPRDELIAQTIVKAKQDVSPAEAVDQPDETAKEQASSQGHLTLKKRRRNRTVGMVAAAAAAVLVVVGGIGVVGSLATDTTHGTIVQEVLVEENATQDLTTLQEETLTTPSSYEELFDSLAYHVFDNARESIDVYSSEAPMASDSMESQGNSGGAAESLDAATPLATEEGLARDASSSAGDYSQTNTQVAGVDEADIVKTDGAHIYSLYNNEVIISRASGKDTVELSRIAMSHLYFNDLYVKDDRLVLMATGTNYSYSSISFVCIYDVSDPANPQMLKLLGQDGYLNTSRLVDDLLYVVSVHYVYYGEDCVVGNPRTYVPNVYEDSQAQSATELDEEYLESTGEALATEDICIMPQYETACYSVISAIDINNASRESKTSVLGNTGTLYMNEDNLFLTITNYSFMDIVPLVENVESSIEPVKEPPRVPSNPLELFEFMFDPEAWFTNGHTGDPTMVDVEPPSSTSPSIVPANTTSVVRLALNEGHPKIEANTVLDGTLLNQFSLDEYQGYLRLAMTSYENLYYEDTDGSQGVAGTQTVNNLYVLNSNLDLVGSIEGLAPDERIYSARFTGEVGYMVTFRETDPLFSLDLSDPFNPVVMDALKIPGFSQYLHPYSDGLLLGIGQETNNSGTTTGEIKLSMFDVSNPYDISEFDKELIDSYYSPALYNHKAVLIDEGKNIIGFEAEYYAYAEEMGPEDVLYDGFGRYYFIYGYDETNGFYQRAAIKLPEEYAESRAVYIGEYLYVVNGTSLGVFALDTLEEITWIEG